MFEMVSLILFPLHLQDLSSVCANLLVVIILIDQILVDVLEYCGSSDPDNVVYLFSEEYALIHGVKRVLVTLSLPQDGEFQFVVL